MGCAILAILLFIYVVYIFIALAFQISTFAGIVMVCIMLAIALAGVLDYPNHKSF